MRLALNAASVARNCRSRVFPAQPGDKRRQQRIDARLRQPKQTAQERLQARARGAVSLGAWAKLRIRRQNLGDLSERTEPAEHEELRQRHDQFRLVARILVVPRGVIEGHTRRVLARKTLRRLPRVGVRLDGQRPGGGDDLDEIGKGAIEAGDAGAEHFAARGVEHARKIPFHAADHHRRRQKRMGAHPQLRVGRCLAVGAPEEFGYETRVAPGVVLYAGNHPHEDGKRHGASPAMRGGAFRAAAHAAETAPNGPRSRSTRIAARKPDACCPTFIACAVLPPARLPRRWRVPYARPSRAPCTLPA